MLYRLIGFPLHLNWFFPPAIACTYFRKASLRYRLIKLCMHIQQLNGLRLNENPLPFDSPFILSVVPAAVLAGVDHDRAELEGRGGGLLLSRLQDVEEGRQQL